MREIKDSLNRYIYVFNNVETRAQQEKFYTFALFFKKI